MSLTRSLSRPVLAVCLLSLSAASARALSLEEAVRRVWASPQLDAQKTQWTLAERDRWRRFFPNEPQLTYANADDRTAVSWGVTETLAFPGKSLAFAGVDSARARAQKAEWNAKRLELARLAAEAYLDAAAARDVAEIQKKNVNDLEALNQALRARYEAGLATQAEVIGSELQLRQLRADLAAQSDKAASARRRLARLVGLPEGEDATLTLPDDVPETLAAEIAGPGPDLLRALTAADVAHASRGTAFWSQMPDISFSAQRNRYEYLPGSPNGRERTWTFGASVSVPLFYPLWEGAESERVRSQAVLDESAARLSRVAAESDAEEAAREYARARARVAEIRSKDGPLAEAMMESTLSAYKSGKLGFAELMLARKTLSDVRAQEIDLRREVVSSRLRCLDRCSGREDGS